MEWRAPPHARCDDRPKLLSKQVTPATAPGRRIAFPAVSTTCGRAATGTFAHWSSFPARRVSPAAALSLGCCTCVASVTPLHWGDSCAAELCLAPPRGRGLGGPTRRTCSHAPPLAAAFGWALLNERRGHHCLDCTYESAATRRRGGGCYQSKRPEALVAIKGQGLLHP